MGVRDGNGVVRKDVTLGTKEENNYWKVITEGFPHQPEFFLTEADYYSYRASVQEVYTRNACWRVAPALIIT